MSYAQKIVSAALAGAAGLFTVERAQGFCLKFSRQCIEKALGKPSHWLYSLMPGDTPRTALGAEQALRKKGWAVPVTEMRPGDLVFFDTVGRGGVTHVGIYLGDDQFVNANSYYGRVVIDKLESDRYWSPRYLSARRILDSGTLAQLNSGLQVALRPGGAD